MKYPQRKNDNLYIVLDTLHTSKVEENWAIKVSPTSTTTLFSHNHTSTLHYSHITTPVHYTIHT